MLCNGESYVETFCLSVCAERPPSEFTGPHFVRFEPWLWICSLRPSMWRCFCCWRGWTTTPSHSRPASNKEETFWYPHYTIKYVKCSLPKKKGLSTSSGRISKNAIWKYCPRVEKPRRNVVHVLRLQIQIWKKCSKVVIMHTEFDRLCIRKYITLFWHTI